jgi:hypothetical protein
MRFSVVTLLATLGALASANTVEFLSQDDTPRTIIFTAQWDQPKIPSLDLAAFKNVTQEFPTGWIGNFHAIVKGANDGPAMLGEFRWDGWGGINWFDVSAIVNPNDNDGIKTIYPKGSGTPVSGCESYQEQCENAYYLSDDIQTKSSTTKDFICTVGTKGASRKVRRHPRHFISGHSRQ